ncbi:NADPH:quinone reductase-like Zn-dependent oxidoreductase [Nocardia transvalensis]|uniref:NADPH:quinone reductase-like Zn-dependent oxidoreductase n=1 Tax=Nocardia transvalensis TaxID=37333 RepID=A0A7W9PJT4_9NOCA|nr:zinc-dependent alcohol dehydrogenase family protein [Nocardia transvalensis]MBB5917469.1 NADPH:quinone reductase-like Zn-dependent oxidoreductase [Nocardia transvalensis]
MTTGTITARTVVFHELGDPDVLTIENRELRAPGPREVRIRVEALGLNRAEALFRAGTYYYLPTLPDSRLGYESSGVIEEIGKDVTEFTVGQNVSTGPNIEMSAAGVYAERVVLPVESVVPRPEGLDAVTGAATWLTYSTAYGGMVETGGLHPGDHVLITAASSGVGIAALQTAARIGAIPIAVTRTGEKRQHLLDNGAAHVLASSETDVVAETRRITGGAGAQLIFDAVGGPGLAELSTAATHNGTIVVYGWLDQRPMAMPMNWPLRILGYANMELSATAAGRRRLDHWIASGIRDGVLRPHVGAVFEGLDSIREAHRLMESSTHTGKIVVKL